MLYNLIIISNFFNLYLNMTKKNVCVNCPKYCRQKDIESCLALLKEDLSNDYKEIIFSCDFCKEIVVKLEKLSLLIDRMRTVRIGVKNSKNIIEYING